VKSLKYILLDSGSIRLDRSERPVALACLFRGRANLTVAGLRVCVKTQGETQLSLTHRDLGEVA
jgi:hypothetical protein